jgi:hypothetical protein
MQMQRIVANLCPCGAKIRRVTENGRQYIVAPLTLIVPGVLNGSKGPLLYPPDEIAANYKAWNGMPLLVNHPTDALGNHLSAQDPDHGPEILKQRGIGEVRNARISKTGALQADGYFDVEKTRRVDRRILAHLEQGKPCELSTGLFTDSEQARPYATHNGKPYSFIARNYRPDHLAVLSADQTGACSVRDGCGVLVNGERAMRYDDDLTTDPIPPREPLVPIQQADQLTYTRPEGGLGHPNSTEFIIAERKREQAEEILRQRRNRCR